MADYLTSCVRVGWISESGELTLQPLACTAVRRHAGTTRACKRLIISGLPPNPAPVTACDPPPEYLDFTPTNGPPQAFHILTLSRDPATGNLLAEVYPYE